MTCTRQLYKNHRLVEVKFPTHDYAPVNHKPDCRRKCVYCGVDEADEKNDPNHPESV